MATNTDSWFPLFEFQKYVYQSYLALPTSEDESASPGTAVTAKKWAKGEFICGQAFGSVGGSGPYSLEGVLRFESNSEQKPELKVSIKGVNGSGNAPASFEATGTGMDGPTRGAIYSFIGWVFPQEPIVNQSARVLRICGAVRAVRGPDTNPEIDLSGIPLGTIGSFVIVSTGPA